MTGECNNRTQETARIGPFLLIFTDQDYSVS